MVLAADLAAFWGVAGTILALAALEGLLVFSGRMVVKRVSQKGALTVVAVLGRAAVRCRGAGGPRHGGAAAGRPAGRG